MSVFTGPLRIEEVSPGKRWKLLDPIRYEAGAKGSGCWVEVPAGMVTDGATIPAALRLMLAVWGSYGRAAALHDYLYSILREGRIWTTLQHRDFPDGYLNDVFDLAGFRDDGMRGAALEARARRWADAEFRTAMLACGTSRPLAWLMWAAVRVFGAKAARPTKA